LKNIKQSRSQLINWIRFNRNHLVSFTILTSYLQTLKRRYIETKIMTKSREKLDSKNSIKFNDTIIAWFENDDIYLNQITQSNHLQLIKKINVDTINSRDVIRFDFTSKKQYVTQRARDAYLVLICLFSINLSTRSFVRFICCCLIDRSFFQRYWDSE
jgi:hypothetical protein